MNDTVPFAIFAYNQFFNKVALEMVSQWLGQGNF